MHVWRIRAATPPPATLEQTSARKHRVCRSLPVHAAGGVLPAGSWFILTHDGFKMAARSTTARPDRRQQPRCYMTCRRRLEGCIAAGKQETCGIVGGCSCISASRRSTKRRAGSKHGRHCPGRRHDVSRHCSPDLHDSHAHPEQVRNWVLASLTGLSVCFTWTNGHSENNINDDHLKMGDDSTLKNTSVSG